MTHKELCDAVRIDISDFPELKRLNGFKVEFDDETIISTMKSALRKINNHGPFKTEYSVAACPENLLINGTIVKLLNSKLHEKAANYLDVVDNGMRINREGNLQIVSTLAGKIEQEFLLDLEQHKDELNFASGWGY